MSFTPGEVDPVCANCHKFVPEIIFDKNDLPLCRFCVLKKSVRRKKND